MIEWCNYLNDYNEIKSKKGYLNKIVQENTMYSLLGDNPLTIPDVIDANFKAKIDSYNPRLVTIVFIISCIITWYNL